MRSRSPVAHSSFKFADGGADAGDEVQRERGPAVELQQALRGVIGGSDQYFALANPLPSGPKSVCQLANGTHMLVDTLKSSPGG